MKREKTFVLSGALLVMAAIACALPTGTSAPTSTPDAQQTIAAAVAATDTAIALVQGTVDAALVGTSVVASPTPADTPTVPAPTATAEQQATPTTAPSSTTSQDPIMITDFGMKFWTPYNSGCKLKGVPCWGAQDSFKVHLGGELILVSKNPVLIDPNWPNPYLVFWHKRNIKASAGLDLKVGSDWVAVQDYSKSKGDWTQASINLNAFKGKEILVRFMLLGVWASGHIPSSEWVIQEVQVVPNFKP